MLDAATRSALDEILAEHRALIEKYDVSLPLDGDVKRRLGTRILNAITRHGITDLVQLTMITREEFTSTPYVGDGMAAQIADLLAEHGLHFAGEE